MACVQVHTQHELLAQLNKGEYIDELICTDLTVTDASLNFVDPANVVLQNCTFNNCIIRDAFLSFGKSENITLNNCVVVDTYVCADIPNCTLRGCTLRSVDLVSPIIDNLTITDSNLHRTASNVATIHKLTMYNTFVHGEHTEMTIHHATLRGNVMHNTTFHDSAMPLITPQATPSPYDANVVYR